MDISELSSKLVLWLQERVKDANADGAVFGMSGGIDSAVVGVLCKKAFGQNALALIMPCYSDEKDERDARLVIDLFGLNYKKVVLDKVYDELVQAAGDTKNMMAKANIKPRIRMTTLYYYAAINNYLVVGATNKSEVMVGYFTKHGDSGSDLWPIANLVKSQVWDLGRFLGIPKEIIDKPPTAGLWSGQTDEKEMGISYKELDNYILNGDAPLDVVERIKSLNSKSNHKRHLPLIPGF
ncbi:MAG TPA: NAD(+) synthase [Thermoanaerobacterales bacterium]|nr:NAD(+) synthase [Thermoanaerobacterales bacterium]